MGDTRATVTLAANLDPSGVLSAVKAMQGAFNNLKLPNNIGEGLDKSLSKATDLLKKYQSQLAKGVDTKTDAKNITKTGAQINEVLDDINHYINELNGQQIFLKADVSGLNKLQTDIEKARTAWKNAIQEFRKNSDIDKVLGGIGEKTTRSNLTQGSINKAKTLFDKGDLEGYRNALDEIYNRVSKLKDTTISNVVKGLGLDDAGSKADNLALIKTQLEAISKLDFSTDENVKAQFDEITNSVSAYENEVKRAGDAGQQAFNDINANKAVNDTRALVTATDQYTDSLMSAKGQVQDLQRSTQYFFSLRNMINLLKRGIDDAIQSVKELDAAMTETAVVTDYKVSDLWGMLPQYTQLANQLGATTQGAYETMTLYFQQGLDQQAAFEIGAETMKMARIAGLEYAETTDMMTAALRGFNMELNETSAKRINDVYSELAAITASDTEELGTAMQRTASIAHSAGMSFEGTTAFLAQAIETTREPAENIGTAMKTIVARFQEMKENPLEISEVDGEEVNYNKVDAALKSIGVSLKDTNGQFRELDQVFLDISSRWDSLSQTQQRYIATVAAGSRQQSRFIAMMDNYDRTVQLFEAANNSAGASDEQFGKTMDSLESKLNKLHNAWQAFTMGIANNGMIKLAVDGLTGFLTVTNKIIDTLSLGSGAIKSFLSVFAAFTGLKMAGRAANSLIGGLGGLVDPQSTVKEGLKIGLFGQGKTNAQAQAITTPIVGVLNKISGQIAQIKNNGINNKGQSSSEIKSTSKQEYANIKAQFDKLSGKEGFKMSDASNLFGKLDAKHQLSMFNNSPGTRIAMKKASMAWFDTKGLSKELTGEGKQYISSIYKGMQEGQIPVDKGVELIGQPQKWGQYFGTETALNYSKSFAKEMSSRAHQEAMQYLVGNPEAYKFQSKEFKDWYNNQANEAQKEAYAKYFKQAREAEEKEGLGQAQGKVSDLGRLANDIGSIGDKFTQAGYGITTFGNALSQLGGPIGAVGTGIAAFGGAISSMGMMVSGATGLITVFSEGIEIAGTSIAISGGAIAAVAAPLAAAAAAFLLVRAHIKKVKEAGEEVTKTFNDTNKEVENNISKLKSYQSEFATLAQGVDSNGNNVSLDDSQYQRYLEIVNDIAAINPEIVQGYNAQGHAIIDNNKALDETLKKQQQIKKETLDTYTKTGSLQKLINARNVNSDYKGIRVKGSTPGAYDSSGHGNEGRQTPIGLGSDVFKIADELRLITTKDGLGKTLKVDDSMLQKYGIESMDALISGEEQAVKNFIKHRDKIQAELTNSGFELSDSLIKGFDKLNEDQKAFDEAIQPVYDNLLASVSNSPFYEEIGSEFKSAIALGLKDIASQDLNASEMQAQANSLVQEFDNLTRAGGEYATAMEQVEGAQDKFAASLDVSEYAKNTEGALNTLNSLLREYEGNTTAYGQAVTEYLTNQIEKIKNFTQEGTVSLTEALNGMTNTISAAEGSYEAFQDATKTDMSTGADNMKSIFEEITKETDGVQLHMERFGDNTMWEGARALLGDEFVEKNAGNVDKVKKEILSLKDELQDGEKGFAAFWENFQKVDASKIEGFQWNEDGSYNIDRNINPDAYKEIAEQMHRSEQYVVSMLNKGRQFADINFTNIEDVRKALSTDSSAIKGSSTSTITNEQGKKETVTDIFVKDDYLKNAVREAVGSNPAEQKEAIDNITKNGVKIIPGPNDMTKKDFKNMGITDLPSLIRTLGDTGQFNRSEIEEYAQQMKGYDEGEFDTLYKDYLNSQEHPELPSINSIDGNVASIAGMLAHNLGIVSQEDRDNYHEANKLTYGEEGVMDSLPQLFSLGQNSKGEALSADEFDSIQKELAKQSQSYENAAKSYDALAEKATKEGNVKDAAWFTEAAADYRKMSKDIDGYITAGIKAYEDANKPKSGGENEGRYWEDYSSVQQGQKRAKKTDEEKEREEQRQKNAKYQEEQARNNSSPIHANLDEWIEKQKQTNAAYESGRYGEQNARNAYNQRIEPLYKEIEQKEQERLELQKQSARYQEEQAKNPSRPTMSLEEQQAQRMAQYWSSTTPEGNLRSSTASSAIYDIVSQALGRTLNPQEQRPGFQAPSSTDFSTALSAFDEGITSWAANTGQLKEKGKQIAQDKSSALDEGIVETVTPENIDQYNGGKNLAGMRNLMSSLFGSILDGDWISTGEETASEASEKASSIWQKMWDGVKKALTRPSEPTVSNQAQSQGNTHQYAPGAPSNIPPNQQSNMEVNTGDSESVLQKVIDLGKKAFETTNVSPAFNLVVNGVPDIQKAAKAAQTLSKSAGTQTIGVKTDKVDTKTVDNATSNIKNTQANLKVGADTGTAKSKVDSFVSQTNRRSATVEVTAHVKKTGISSITVEGKTVSITTAASGMNNHRSYASLPSFGSLAKGTKSRNGQIGPKNKGGLTLTGEEGYEIAWIPDENRSMILGANGPQMLNLPSNAVVWTHEQSKKIMKQKAIPAHSMDSGSYKPAASTTTPTATITRNNNPTISKSLSDAGKKVQQDSKEAKEKIARVSVWWENIARRTEATQRKMDNNAKSFEKYLKNTNATLKGAGKTGKGNAYIKNIQDYVDLNTKQVRRANKELKKLYKGKGTSNSESEKNQKRLKKRYKKGDVNVTEVSYDKKGKSKKAFVDLNKYITKDSATGALQVSEKKLKKISNVNKRKAVAEAANKEIDDRTAKKTKAEDAIQKAQDALDKMGQDLYETFFKWETELTKIWNITQKIEAAEARAAEAKEGSSLLEAQLASGRAQATQEFAEQSKKIYQLELDNEVKALQQKAASVQDKQEALNRAINIDDEIAQLNAITDKLNGSTAAKAKADKAEQTLNSKQAKLNKKQAELNQITKAPYMPRTDAQKRGYNATRVTFENVKYAQQLQQEIDKLTTQVNAAKQTYNTAQVSILNDTQRHAYETYAQELQNDIKTQQQASRYTTISRMGDGTVEIEFDSKALMDAKDAGAITSDEAKRIEDYVKNIQDTNKDLQDTYKDVTTGMTDMYNRLDTLKDNWVDYADQLWDISDKEQQERVNELKDLSTSINNALKNLLDNVKKKLDERRQQEDNAKTEADISRKQQRLTMLQADTSGGHQVEIAQLQQEIAEAQQNYQRSLEDQLLERLQNQADVAAEQRERMIELEEGTMNAINNATLVDTWMTAAKQASLTGNPAELEQYKEQMYNAYMAANDADQKPEAIRQQLETSFNTLYNGLLTNQAEQKAVSDKLDVLEGTKEDVASASSTLGQILNQLESMNIVDSVQKDPNAGKGAEAKAAVDDSKKAVASSQKSNTKTNAQVYKEKLDQYSKNGKLSNKELDNIIKYGKAAGKSEAEIVKALAGTKVTWKDIITEAKQNKYTESRVKGWFSSGWSKKHKESFAKAFNDIYKPKKKMKEKYVTGGLNTYTGPAWLDGTPSKPELVLNAQDTKNFIALKDVLSKAIGSTSHIENSYGGDANFEININVDHISNDYDVNKVVDQVEKRIVQKSGYRNVTQVRNFR